MSFPHPRPVGFGKGAKREAGTVRSKPDARSDGSPGRAGVQLEQRKVPGPSACLSSGGG